MEFAIIISALIANIFTKIIKPAKTELMTASEIESRKSTLRVVNAVLGIVALLSATAITGVPLDVTTLQSFIEVIVAFAITFISSQGMYFMAKKQD